MTDPTGFTISTAVTLDVRWQYSHHACYGVFQSVHTCTHTDTGMCTCTCTEVPDKIPLTFSETLWMPLHFSADKGWASVMGVTARALWQILGWPLSIAEVTAELSHWGRCCHSPLRPQRVPRASLSTTAYGAAGWLALVISQWPSRP